jgi:hypothetical protein
MNAEASEERIGHYRILAELGEDELGFFLGAVDERLDRMVVLRVSRPAEDLGAAAEEVRDRMREGARVASHLNHPNLVTVYEYLPLRDGDLLALEQVEGDTLEQLHLRGERWTVLDIARTLARLADAVAAAHGAGLAHGRINVANVKIRPDGRVKLLDLGVPREIDDDGGVLRPDPADDVVALAALACELLAPPGADVAGWPALLADPVRARAALGFLAPVLSRVFAAEEAPGFSSAAEFRDAVLLALESAAGRSGSGAGGRGMEASFSTRVIGPAAAMGDQLPEDGRALAALGRVPGTGGPTRLVLPSDLAERVPTDLQSRLGAGAEDDDRPVTRPGPSRWTRIALVAVALILVVGTVAVIQATRRNGDEAGASPTPVAEDPGAIASPSEPAPAPVDSGIAEDSAAPPPPTVLEASARVRVTPTDANIRAVGVPGSSWRDGDEVSVASGDTVLLEFARAGYVPVRLPFVGSRLSVSLVPDSAFVTFEANVQADIYLVTGDGEEIRLGSTTSVRRLPTGTYTFLLRAPGQRDWQTTVGVTRPGASYAVSKTDYATTGGLVATVPGGWANASLDGGVAKETPATWSDIAAGPHVLRLSRDGFRTVVDTVIVPGGDVLRRQYTLQRGS